MDKKVFDVKLYDNGNIEVNNSNNNILYANDIFWFSDKQGTGIKKQCYEENIERVKKYLLNHRIKEWNEELNKLKDKISKFTKVKNDLE